MSTPKEITFTLEGKPVDAAAVPKPGPDGVLVPVPVYGPEFGGPFVLRWPSILDRGVIGGRLTAFFEREGVENPFGIDAMVYGLMHAIVFFDVLATTKPSWVSLDLPATPDAELALLRAFAIARETIGAEKKTSIEPGAPASNAP